MRDLFSLSSLQEWVATLGSVSSPSAASSAGDGCCAPVEGPPQLYELEPIKLVGRGGFASVVLVRHTVSGRPFALKTMSVAKVRAQSQVEHVNAELEVLRRSDHPFIIGYHGGYRTDSTLNLLLDFAPGGDLYYHMNRVGVLEAGAMRFYAAELTLALRYLHDLGAIYRDLKPENVLLDADGHVRLADFGLSKVLQGDDDRARSMCGTQHYLAPEVVAKASYGRAVDYWALGCLLFELLTGLPPFYAKSKNRARLYRAIASGVVVYPEDMDPLAVDLIDGLLTVDVEARLANADELLEHPFFDGLDLDALLRKEAPGPFATGVDADDTSNVDPEFTSLPLSSVFSVPASRSQSSDSSPAFPNKRVVDDEFAEWEWSAPVAVQPSVSVYSEWECGL